MTPEHPASKFFEVFRALAEGRTDPVEWMAWWNGHAAEVEAVLPRGWFLRIKPPVHDDGPGRSAVLSQTGVCYVLDQLNVPHTTSDRYQAAWTAHLNSVIAEHEMATEVKAVEFGPIIAALVKPFPKFGRFLKKNAGDIFSMKSGLCSGDIDRLEKDLSTTLPATYKAFLMCAAEVVFGDTLQLNSTHPFIHTSDRIALPTEGMLCFAEYWLEGDGDQVLFDLRQPIDDPPVLYYNHDVPSVRMIAKNFKSWVESLPKALR